MAQTRHTPMLGSNILIYYNSRKYVYSANLLYRKFTLYTVNDQVLKPEYETIQISYNSKFPVFKLQTKQFKIAGAYAPALPSNVDFRSL